MLPMLQADLTHYGRRSHTSLQCFLGILTLPRQKQYIHSITYLPYRQDTAQVPRTSIDLSET